MAYLTLANIKKEYNVSRTETQTVLKDINIEFKQGELVALLGESGCGKSTLINILGGLDTNYTGSIILNGDFLKDYSEKDMDDYRKKQIGMIFQSYNLIMHLSVIENVMIAMKISGLSENRQRERALKLLKVVRLEGYADKMPNQLSGGQKQRVAIARALANNPEIILADEPTGALDKDSAEMVMLILKKIAKSGKLVIIVTHSQKVADECSRIVNISDGVVAYDRKVYNLQSDVRPKQAAKPHSITTKNLAKLSWRNLWQNKRRSLLVSIAMSIGIAAVIIILSLSMGITDYVNEVMVGSMDALKIEIEQESGAAFSSKQISVIKKLDGVAGVDKSCVSRLNVNYSCGENVQGVFLAVSVVYGDEGFTLLSGREPSDNEILINNTFAKTISSVSGYAEEVLGSEISLDMGKEAITLTTSGVYEDSSSYADFSCAYVTENTLTELYGTVNKTVQYNRLIVTVESTSYITAVEEDLETLGYVISDGSSSIGSIFGYIDIGTTVLTAVSAISLVVSAIMIFIVLYISVIERTKEIGVLRAIGGTKSDIKKLFLFEAAFLGLISGIFAVAVSLLVTITVNLCTASLGVNIISYYYGIYYAVGLLLSVILSTGAGYAPAAYAAGLDPVDSLRCE